jgi:hypothetical protein
MRKEIWRDVMGWEGLYKVSDWGRVRSLPRVVIRRNGRRIRIRGKFLRLHQNNKGYLYVVLSDRGDRSDEFVHRLLLEAFVGPRPEGMETRHLDDCPTNNQLENICWGTRQENQQDRIRNGRTNKGKVVNRGVHNGMSKITPKTANDIRDKYATGDYTQRELSELFGVCQANVSLLVNNKRWSY